MSLIIAGTVRIPPENLARLKPHMLAMLTASRAEDGCLEYSYGEDVADPGLIRVFEICATRRRSTPTSRRRTWPPGGPPAPSWGFPTAGSSPTRPHPNARSSLKASR